ncbi:MAG TPA: bisanhydrobacterioruberin hydratase CruF [Abditibacteriaceae bacterium]|nr:bisanhydrobacterioruberin hydratase CruF [Abditibacteriaceae bacterium]
MNATQSNFSKAGASRKSVYFSAAALLMLCGFFVAKIPVRPELAGVSSVFVVVFALPSCVAVIRWLGWRSGLRLLLVLAVFAIILESFAVATGIPYGRFVYGEKIGAKVLGLVPWTVPFAWSPLLLASMALAPRWSSQPLMTAVLSGLTLVLIDMVLDPAAVAQQFWTWEHPGVFYQVPISNFIGWFLSGVVGSLLFQRFAGNRHLPPLNLLSSGFLILCFWTSVCFWMELWIPAALGLALLIVISLYFFQFEPRLSPGKMQVRSSL